MLPAPWNVRSRVIEYGGQPWAGARAASGGPLVVFVHFADQRLYALRAGRREPRPLTPVSPVGGGLRWADPLLRPERGEVWCVLEEFTGDGPTDVRRVLAAVPLDGSAAEDRARRTGTHRRPAPVRHRPPALARRAAGRLARLGPPAHAVGRHGAASSPRSATDGTLRERPDRRRRARRVRRPGRLGAGRPALLVRRATARGWWNLPTADGGEPRPVPARGGVRRAAVEARPALVRPAGQRTRSPSCTAGAPPPSASSTRRPANSSTRPGPGPSARPPSPCTAAGSSRVGASPRSAYEVVELDTRTGRARVIGAAHDDAVDPAYYPEPQIRTFTGPDGPRDPRPHLPAAPPRLHRARRRAAAVRGVGARRPHRTRAARPRPGDRLLHLARHRRRRGQLRRLHRATAGSTATGCASSGAWSTSRTARPSRWPSPTRAPPTATGSRSAAAARAAGPPPPRSPRTDVYACGTIIYPDPRPDRLGAPGRPMTSSRGTWRSWSGRSPRYPAATAERSPAEHADRITAPFLLLQGLDDVICPPAQCERFLARMAGRRMPHAYLAFEGEGHGFRRAETMIRALEAELSLYAQVFGLARTGVPSSTGAADAVNRSSRATAHGSPGPARPGAVAVVAPSGPVPEERLEAGLDILRGWDLDPVVAPHVLDRHREFGYLAGTDADRAADLQRPGATRPSPPCCAPAAATAPSAWSTCSTGRRCGRRARRCSSASATSPRCTRRSPSALGTGHAARPHGRRRSTSSRTPARRSSCGPRCSSPETVRTLGLGAARALVPGRARGVTLGGCLSLLAAELGTPHARPVGTRRAAADRGRGRGAVPPGPVSSPNSCARAGWTGCAGVAARLLGGRAARTRTCARCSPTGSAGSGCRSSRSSGSGTATATLTMPLGVAGGAGRRDGHADAGRAGADLTPGHGRGASCRVLFRRDRSACRGSARIPPGVPPGSRPGPGGTARACVRCLSPRLRPVPAFLASVRCRRISRSPRTPGGSPRR